MLADAQVHLWGADSPDRPWPVADGNVPHRAQPVDLAETLRVLDEAGVHRAVLVPPSWEGDRNDLALAAAARHPDRFAVMGRFPLAPAGPVGTPQAGQEQARRLLGWRERPGLLGVRLTLHRDPWRAQFLRGELDWFWAAADDAGLPVMVYAPGLSPALGAVARRHPGLRLIVDHLALPVGLTGPAAFAGLSDLLALARFPQVAVKATGLPCHSAQEYPFRDLHRPIEQVFQRFGAERLFWGSDWTRLPCSYRENLTLFTEELPFLSGADLRGVLGGSLLAFLGWAP